MCGMVVVRFNRTDDLDRDRRRLINIHGRLQSYPGLDRFRIVLCDGDHEVPMDFPNHTTGYSDGLVVELETIGGVEVSWHPLTVPIK